MVYKVFISHSNHQDDWERVQSFERWLKNMGIQPILARRTYEPEPVSDMIKNMIDSSDVLLVLWTANSENSGFVNQEVGYASGHKPIIVLRDPDTHTTGFIHGLNSIDLSADRAREELQKLGEYLIDQRRSKEFGFLLVAGIAAFAGALGLALLFSGIGEGA